MSQEKKHAFIHWQLPPEFSIHWPFTGLSHHCLWVGNGGLRVRYGQYQHSNYRGSCRGVGPELAKRIVDFRERYGEFKSIEALGDVRGIGPSLLAKNKGKIVTE